MKKSFKVEVELTAGQMAAIIRAVERVRLEEYMVGERSPEWERLSESDKILRVAFAEAMMGGYPVYTRLESGRFARRLDLTYRWSCKAENPYSARAAANVRLNGFNGLALGKEVA